MANKTRFNDEVRIPQLYVGGTYDAESCNKYQDNDLIYVYCDKYDVSVLCYYEKTTGKYYGILNNIVFGFDFDEHGKLIIETDETLTTDNDFEKLVNEVPTDVKLVEDETKLQLQLLHDTKVLSINESFNQVIGKNCGRVYKTDGSMYSGIIWFRDEINEYLIHINNELLEIQIEPTVSKDSFFIIMPKSKPFLALKNKINENDYSTCIIYNNEDDDTTRVDNIICTKPLVLESFSLINCKTGEINEY